MTTQDLLDLKRQIDSTLANADVQILRDDSKWFQQHPSPYDMFLGDFAITRIHNRTDTLSGKPEQF